MHDDFPCCRPTDDTTELAAVAAAPLAVTASSEESEAEALVAELSARLQGVRVLAPSRADETARAALREELSRMVATAQQLDAHLAEAVRAAHDAKTDAVLSHLEGGQR
jgi:hypothetical protein